MVLVRQTVRVAATRRRRDRQLAPRAVDELVDAERNGREHDEEDDDDDCDHVVALRHGGWFLYSYFLLFLVWYVARLARGGDGESVGERNGQRLPIVLFFVVTRSV